MTKLKKWQYILTAILIICVPAALYVLLWYLIPDKEFVRELNSLFIGIGMASFVALLWNLDRKRLLESKGPS